MLVIFKNIIPKGFVGLSLFPFIFLKYDALKQNAVLVQHEKIHLRQQAELLVLPFFVLYALEFLIRLLHYKNKRLAYKNISFEREAYAKENEKQYLKKRPFFAWVRYL